MENQFPLEVLFSDGTTAKQLEDNKKVIAVKIDDKNFIGLRNKSVKDSLDGSQRSCDRDASRNKEGVVLAPPALKTVKAWMEKRSEINQTMKMLKEQGVETDKLEGEIMTSTRSGKFNNYSFNVASGEERLVSSNSTVMTLRPSVSIDKSEVVPARNIDPMAYGIDYAVKKMYER